MEPDPRFPNRPTHPDLDRLSAAVIANDAVMDEAIAEGRDLYDAYVKQFCDTDVLTYMATARVSRMLKEKPAYDVNEAVVTSVASWVDGFMAAASMFTRRQVQDGQHRGTWRPFTEPVEHPRD